MDKRLASRQTNFHLNYLPLLIQVLDKRNIFLEYKLYKIQNYPISKSHYPLALYTFSIQFYDYLFTVYIPKEPVDFNLEFLNTQALYPYKNICSKYLSNMSNMNSNKLLTRKQFWNGKYQSLKISTLD